jgi:hypothetical protein
MAKVNTINRADLNKTKKAAQATYENAKDIAKEASGQVQDRVKAGLRGTQGLLAIMAGILGALLQRNAQKAQKDWHKTQKRISPMQEEIQDRVTNGLGKTQKTMQVGLTAAQQVYAKNAKKAQENLKKAQKNMHAMQESLQTSVIPAVATGVAVGLAKTQDVLHKGSEKANQGLQQVAGSARGVKESMQDQYTHYQQKRQRARSLFRWGIIAGIALALMFTPLTGSEVRQRLAEQWQRYRSYIGL